MANRLVNGEKVWRSEKLLQVQPESFRAELANLIPLALANGVFECTPGRVRSDVYSFNRPSITINKVAKILDEFERVKLLFRWRDAGKVYGFWTGIRSGGLLPSPEECSKKRYKIGPEPPEELLQQFLSGQIDSGLSDIATELPTGSPRAAHGLPPLGVGVGVGVGAGAGIGAGGGVGSRFRELQHTDAELPAMNANEVPSKPSKKERLKANLKKRIADGKDSYAEVSKAGKYILRSEDIDAFRAMKYEPELDSPEVTIYFLMAMTDVYEENLGKNTSPGNLCSKVIDECEKQQKQGETGYYWPPDFQEHRNRLRASERNLESIAEHANA
jgi:hypothetical protein